MVLFFLTELAFRMLFIQGNYLVVRDVTLKVFIMNLGLELIIVGNVEHDFYVIELFLKSVKFKYVQDAILGTQNSDHRL